MTEIAKIPKKFLFHYVNTHKEHFNSHLECYDKGFDEGQRSVRYNVVFNILFNLKRQLEHGKSVEDVIGLIDDNIKELTDLGL